MLTTFITRLISIFKQFHKPKCIFIRTICRTFCGLLHNRDFFHWPTCHILHREHVMQHVTKIGILYQVFLDMTVRNFRRSLYKWWFPIKNSRVITPTNPFWHSVSLYDIYRPRICMHTFSTRIWNRSIRVCTVRCKIQKFVDSI